MRDARTGPRPGWPETVPAVVSDACCSFPTPHCCAVEPGDASTPSGGSYHEESPRGPSRASLAHGRDVCGPNLVDAIDARALQEIGFQSGPAGRCPRWSTGRNMWTMALFSILRAMERLTGRAGKMFLALRQLGVHDCPPNTTL